MNKLNAIDQETIKVLNQKKIIQLLYRNKQMTKQDISKELKISIPTVISNVKELIEQGFLDEAGVGESSGGRKPTIVRFLPDSRYSFGVCITKDQVRIILTNLNLEIIADKSLDMPEELDNFNSLVLQIKKEIDHIIDINSIPIDKILGIGFSLPGTVDEKKLLLENAPNLKLKNISFENFQHNFQFPLFTENEANASAYAESFINFNGIISSLVFISITEGIGTGIIIGDNLYKGYNKRAGEFGHMTIVKDGKQCNCGKRGCWELYASKKALVNEYRKKFDDCDKKLNDFLELSKSNLLAKDILDNYLGYLAEGIKNIILMLDPRDVIIGGELSNYKTLIEADLKKKVFQENSFYNQEECKISFSDLEENASILGAALLPMEKLFYLNEKII
ncbi:ROK family transcriptional regulator [Clostridium magnum]|uniref:N-acetylglucosamine repressor n=1 Tax=Clostridium magnum DSM 2767 TaxID=1121326 RepID=A0A161WH08_9CLOT|nr:ROK family transcriptional regulator [Clostridium magnum]KZL90965.1 N-acetylglucosamine repressor [Clostridium magnum DSM 2767]SHI99955.1 Sugar kinase of the NBD/HSP70 family, may contain an N-terminal HTH domain [Clostridium magnum DSM 2767]